MTKASRDLGWLGAICAGFGVLWFAPYARGLRLPIGPDVLVYLWWSRAAAARGLSVLGFRGGAPAVLLTLAGALHMPLTAVLAGLLIALAVAVVPLCASLARRAGGGSAWLASAVLAGAFARFLVWGYLANLSFSVMFLAALVLLVAPGDRRSTVGAALLLAAGGLLHPQFLMLGATVLFLAAATARWRDHDISVMPRRTAAAAAGGLLMAGLGLASLRIGPPALLADTAPDALLRAAGLTRELVNAYRVRFEALVVTDGLWLLLESGFAVVARATGFVGRLLGTWGAVTVLALPMTFLLPLFAGQRLVFFAFFLPILAGIGLVRVAHRTSWSALAKLAIAAVLAIVVLRTASWWWNAEPYVSEPELAAAETASRAVGTLPAETQLVFVVHEPDRALVLPSQVLNTIRTVLPPDRGEDVRVYFGPPEDVFARRPSSNDAVIRALQQRVVDSLGQDDPVVFVLRPFDDQPAAFTDPRLRPLSSDVAVSAAPATLPAPYVGVQRTSSGGIALALLFTVAILCAAGLGWSSSLRRDGLETAALTPACGLGALVAASIIVDRVGLPLSGSAGPTLAVALAAVPGYVLAFRPGRRGQPAARQRIRR